jgi:hypothetical protein
MKPISSPTNKLYPTYIMHNENSSILHKHHHKKLHSCSIKNTHCEGTKTKTNHFLSYTISNQNKLKVLDYKNKLPENQINNKTKIYYHYPNLNQNNRKPTNLQTYQSRVNTYRYYSFL